MKKKIVIHNILGNKCISSDDGEMICDIISPLLEQRQQIELNFEGIDLLTSPFLHAAFGRLCYKFSDEDLYYLLCFKSVTPKIQKHLESIKIAAKRYKEYPEHCEDSFNKAFHG